jgi:nucleoside-diphosphate-sugar epimerase
LRGTLSDVTDAPATTAVPAVAWLEKNNEKLDMTDEARARILSVDRTTLDLTNQGNADHWIDRAKPNVVIVAAARLGGIAYNNANPVELSDNPAIALNIIKASFLAGIEKLLFLGSSCIYRLSSIVRRRFLLGDAE